MAEIIRRRNSRSAVLPLALLLLLLLSTNREQEQEQEQEAELELRLFSKKNSRFRVLLIGSARAYPAGDSLKKPSARATALSIALALLTVS